MIAQKEVVTLLDQELRRIRSRNPAYSLRSLARKLKVSPATLSGVMNGKLNVTRRLGEKVAGSIPIDPLKRERLLLGLKNKNTKTARSLKVPDGAYSLVDMDQYHLIADWFYFAILSLSETKDFRGNEKWIARRLNLSLCQTKQAVQRLIRLGLLERDNTKRLIGTGRQFRTSSGTPNSYLRFSHHQNVELAKRSLEKDDVDDCDFSAMTMAIDPEKLREAKEVLREFRRSFSQRFEIGERTEVFRLCLQLFPLSEIRKVKEKRGIK